MTLHSAHLDLLSEVSNIAPSTLHLITCTWTKMYVAEQVACLSSFSPISGRECRSRILHSLKFRDLIRFHFQAMNEQGRLGTSENFITLHMILFGKHGFSAGTKMANRLEIQVQTNALVSVREMTPSSDHLDLLAGIRLLLPAKKVGGRAGSLWPSSFSSISGRFGTSEYFITSHGTLLKAFCSELWGKITRSLANQVKNRTWFFRCGETDL